LNKSAKQRIDAYFDVLVKNAAGGAIQNILSTPEILTRLITSPISVPMAKAQKDLLPEEAVWQPQSPFESMEFFNAINKMDSELMKEVSAIAKEKKPPHSNLKRISESLLYALTSPLGLFPQYSSMGVPRNALEGFFTPEDETGFWRRFLLPTQARSEAAGRGLAGMLPDELRERLTELVKKRYPKEVERILGA